MTLFVKTTDHNIQKIQPRKKALKTYKEGAYFCEGSEQQQYMDIYFDLCDGFFNVSSEESLSALNSSIQETLTVEIDKRESSLSASDVKLLTSVMNDKNSNVDLSYEKYKNLKEICILYTLGFNQEKLPRDFSKDINKKISDYLDKSFSEIKDLKNINDFNSAFDRLTNININKKIKGYKRA